MAEWVKQAWDEIDPKLIQRSFKCCEISNNENGIEDSLIFDYDKVENIEKITNNMNSIEFNNNEIENYVYNSNEENEFSLYYSLQEAQNYRV
ncbi:14900_t:CDS:2 [Acaulospora morrowiae]|uniref:14900_t:CDS:1 n=1 Tax=Acaulospora morrowiae TaxID=94023 RepID=A0A9N8ZS34_9GLOM|nr:14900_t:CDS:2 [Acaulospora morrowiae]